MIPPNSYLGLFYHEDATPPGRPSPEGVFGAMEDPPSSPMEVDTPVGAEKYYTGRSLDDKKLPDHLVGLKMDLDKISITAVEACSFIEKHLLQRASLISTDRTPGRVDYEAEIPLSPHKPWHMRLKSQSPADREEIARVVQRNLKLGLIRPCKSPYASSVVLVRKPTGRHQIACSLIACNNHSIKDLYPLPLIRDGLDSLSGAKYYSSIDICGAYLSIPVKREDQEKLAFITHEGLFCWCVLPYGYKNSSPIWCRVIDGILQGLRWTTITNYADDVLVHAGQSFTEHADAIGETLDRLQKGGLRISIDKCLFFQRDLEFLGFEVSAEGTRPSRKTTNRILNAKVETVKDCRSFVASANYFRRHVAYFSRIAAPMYKGELSDPVSPEQAEAAALLKTILTTRPVLRHADFNKRFLLSTDGAATGLGAVLQQVGEKGLKHVIAYASRSLNANQKRYAGYLLECMAAAWAMAHFRHYLVGREFTLLTDCNALKALRGEGKSLTGPIGRWAIEVQEYEFKVEHVPGRQHQAADFMSRTAARGAPDADVEADAHTAKAWNLSSQMNYDDPPPGTLNAITRSNAIKETSSHDIIECESDGDDEGETPLVVPAEYPLSPAIPSSNDDTPMGASSKVWVLNAEAWHRAQNYDPEVMRLRRLLLLPLNENDPVQSRVHQYYIIEENLVKLRNSQGSELHRVVVPDALQVTVITHVHGLLCHPSAKKTHKTICRLFYWKKMREQIQAFIRGCLPCQRRKVPRPLRAGLTQPMLEQRPWSTIALDFLHTRLPKAHGYRHLLVAICPFCRWPIGIPLKTKDHEEIADRLMEKVFSVHGFPRTILTDNENVLVRPALNYLLEKLNIHHNTITVRHPQGNSHCERFMRFLNSSFTILLPRYSEWPRLVERVLFIYRTVPHDTYGLSPFFMLYGRHPVLPLELSLGPGVEKPQDPPQDQDKSEEPRWDHTRHLLDTLHHTYEYVRYVQKKAAENNKARRDAQGRRYPAPTFNPHDFVLLWDPGDKDSVYSAQRNERVDFRTKLTNKRVKKMNQGLKFKWSGPHRVIKRLQTNVYLIDHCTRKEPLRANVDSLVAWDPFNDLPDTSTLTAPQWIPHLDKYPSAVPQPGFPEPGDLCVIWQPWGTGPGGSYSVVRFLKWRQYGDPHANIQVEHHMECQWYGHTATEEKALRMRRWLPGWMSTSVTNLSACYWREEPAPHSKKIPCTNWTGGEHNLGVEISPHHVVTFGFYLQPAPANPLKVIVEPVEKDHGYLTESTLDMVRRHRELPIKEKGDPGPEHTIIEDADDLAMTPPKKVGIVGAPIKNQLRNVAVPPNIMPYETRARKRARSTENH